MSHTVDTLIIGAGAAGLFCGAEIARAGSSVLVVDHAKKPAEKVRISGGGRCNFTNINTKASNFLSENPHFAKSALARYTPRDFCDLMSKHGLSWTEKTLGQLFCEQRAGAIIEMLLQELDEPGGELWLQTDVGAVSRTDNGFLIQTSRGAVSASHLVIATGGLSIPKMGATGFAYEIAEQFGHHLVTPRPALVPLTFSGSLQDDFEALSGVATDATITAGGASFTEAMLFTHRGLSGPSVLQASSYWDAGAEIAVDLLPGIPAFEALKDMRETGAKRPLGVALAEHMPRRLTEMLGKRLELPMERRLGDLSNKALEATAAALSHWTFKPTGTEGWRTAEVTAGGIATGGLSSKTLESHHQKGLYFIGECVDVTGWLGGYNFQWAWASAVAAGQHIGAQAT